MRRSALRVATLEEVAYYGFEDLPKELMPPIAGGSLPSLIAHTASQINSTAITTGSLDTTGANLIVVSAAYFGNGNEPNVFSDSKGNTWTNLVHGIRGSSQIQAAYCIPSTVGTAHTFTWSNAVASASAVSMEVAAFSGIGNTSLDINEAAAGVQPGSATPSQSGELIISSFICATSASYTVDSGFTITDQVSYSSGNWMGSALAYLIQSASVAVNPSWSASDLYSQATMASFRYFSSGSRSIIVSQAGQRAAVK